MGRKSLVIAATGIVGCVVLGFVLLDGSEQSLAADPVPVDIQGTLLTEPVAGTTSPEETAPVAPNPAPSPSAPPETVADRKKEVLSKFLRDERGYLQITIKDLSSYTYPEPKKVEEGREPPPSPIPEEIRLLDGEKVTLFGYVMPVDVKDGEMFGFLLVPSLQQCCFGEPVMINEFIDVTRKDGGVIQFNEILDVSGVLEVGEVYEEGKWLLSVYRLKADEIRILD